MLCIGYNKPDSDTLTSPQLISSSDSDDDPEFKV